MIRDVWRVLRRDVPDCEGPDPAPRTGGLPSTSGRKGDSRLATDHTAMGHLQVGVQPVVARSAPNSSDAGLESYSVAASYLAVAAKDWLFGLRPDGTGAPPLWASG